MPAYSRILLPWESQPQEAVRGLPSFGGCDLDHLWALNVGGGRSVLDSAGFADGVFGAGTGGTSGNQWLLDQNGFYINYSDAGTGSANSKILNVGSSGGSGSPSNPDLFSVVARIQVATLAADTCIYGGASPTFSFRLTTAGKLSLVKGGAGTVATSTGTLSTNTTYDVGVSWDGAEAKFYINGALDSTVTGAFSGFLSAVQYGLGAITGIVGSNSSRMYRCAVFTGVLPQGGFQELARNGFWQLFTPRAIWVPVSAGGGGTSISGALGTAVASGFTGTINANRSIAGALGTATASGFTGTVSNSTNTAITGALGVATASGFKGTVGANRGIAGALGAAVASGFTGAVTNDNSTTISGALGTATATGFTGAITWNRYISGLLGVAQASGFAGGVQNGAAPIIATGGGIYPTPRRKTKQEIDKDRKRLGILPDGPEVQTGIVEGPKRPKITLEQLIGKPAADTHRADMERASAAHKLRKRRQDDDLLMMM